MRITKELVKCFPEHWEADIYTHEIYLMPGSDAPFSSIAIDGKSESPGFINWALDELAKKDCRLDFDITEKGVVWFCTWAHAERIGVGVVVREQETPEYPTKTLALAHALIEVTRG